MLDTELLPAAEADSKWLMVVLHGLGDSMEGYRWFPGIMENPKLNYLLVNAPDDYYGGFSWYDIYDKPAPGVDRSRNLSSCWTNSAKPALPLSTPSCLGFRRAA